MRPSSHPSGFAREPRPPERRLRRRPRSAAACLRELLRLHERGDEAAYSAGETLLDLFAAITDLGFEAAGYRGDAQALRELNGPALLPLAGGAGGEYFALYRGFDGRRFLVWDPDDGIVHYTSSELKRLWPSGAMLTVSSHPPADSVRIKWFGEPAAPFGYARVLVRSESTGTMTLLPVRTAGKLIAMASFRTRETHEARATARFGAAEPVAPQLTAAVRDGLFVQESDLKRSVMRVRSDHDADPAPPITSLSVPTRDRAATVDRSLRTYVEHALLHGRTLRFIVADSSGAPGRKATGRVIEGIRSAYGVRIDHLTDAWKTRCSTELATLAECPEETVRFALFGRPDWGPDFGANRNALLLATVGEMSLQVDDDTLLPPRSTPIVEEGLELSSAADPNEYWFGPAATSARLMAEVDFLAMHEELLGRAPDDCLRDVRDADLYVDAMGPELLRVIKGGGARVGATFAGHIGDAGAETNASRLFLARSSLGRLIADYSVHVRSRTLLRTVRRRTISNGPFCLSANIGMDQRILLPPFPPVGRNEDGVFSSLLATYVPAVLRGFLPRCAHLHDPPELRADFPPEVRFAGFRVNDLMGRLIAEGIGSPSKSSADALRAAGHHLQYVSRLPQNGFERFMRSFASRRLGVEATDVEQALAHGHTAGPDVARDREAFLASVEAFALRDDVDAPIDLPGASDERRARFKSLLASFGSLLIHWPEIVESAGLTHSIADGHA